MYSEGLSYVLRSLQRKTPHFWFGYCFSCLIDEYTFMKPLLQEVPPETSEAPIVGYFLVKFPKRERLYVRKIKRERALMLLLPRGL